MPAYAIRKSPGDSQWFRHDRFGMFIHWGLYAMPARHEWVKTREKMTEKQYQRYFDHFEPDMFDPHAWAAMAKAAGMKYAVLTTKHHDGFCLFDSAFTDYKSTNTPAGRDLVKEFVEAFRAEGLKIGFYYSLIDWHHPDFPIDMLHPRREDKDAQQQNNSRDMRRYALYMRNQVTELLTNYGKIDVLWFDFSYPDNPPPLYAPWMRGKGKTDWEAEELIRVARSIQPDILIDNRTGVEQDLTTPEQYQCLAWPRHKETGELLTWEACQTFSGSWGYYRDEQTWKSPEMLLRMLIDTVSLGGNLLMNVGPTARGYLDRRAQEALGTFAEWMKYNSRSVYGCTMADASLTVPPDCRLTQTEDGKRVYIHLFAYPFGALMLPGWAGRVEYAQFLHDGSEIEMTEGQMEQCGDLMSIGNDTLVLHLPPVKPGVLIPVIEIFLKDDGAV